MEHSFWHSKWQNNEIAFHEPQGNALLVKHSSVLLSTAKNPTIFVPLCGKTKDIGWFLSKGCSVVGAELSEVATQQLFEELNVQPVVEKTATGLKYSVEGLTVFVGDIFTLSSNDIGNIDGVYDRAALVALPEQIRAKYSVHIVEITQRAPQLVISFDYDQEKMPGPPFSVDVKTVSALYEQHYQITLLERSDVEGGLKRKVNADNLVFSLK